MNKERRKVLTSISRELTEAKETLKKQSKLVATCYRQEESYLDKMNINTKQKLEKAEEALDTLGYIKDQLDMIDGLLSDLQTQIDNAKA